MSQLKESRSWQEMSEELDTLINEVNNPIEEPEDEEVKFAYQLAW